jgi:hypothetical protein
MRIVNTYYMTNIISGILTANNHEAFINRQSVQIVW